MYLKNKGIVYIFIVVLYIFGLKLVDLMIKNDFNALLDEGVRVVENNLSNEERGGLGLNNKLRFISLSQKLKYVPYVEYKLRYCHKYIFTDNYPEKEFIYYF